MFLPLSQLACQHQLVLHLFIPLHLPGYLPVFVSVSLALLAASYAHVPSNFHLTHLLHCSQQVLLLLALYSSIHILIDKVVVELRRMGNLPLGSRQYSNSRSC